MVRRFAVGMEPSGPLSDASSRQNIFARPKHQTLYDICHAQDEELATSYMTCARTWNSAKIAFGDHI